MTRWTASLLLLITAMLWGFTFVVQKWVAVGDTTMQPLAFTGLRFLFGALVVTPLMWHESKRQPPLSRSMLGQFALCGVMLFMGSWLQQRGVALTSVSNAGFFTGLYVVLTPVVGWLLFRHRPHQLLWPVVALSLAGIWCLNGGTLTRFSTGDLWVMLCSVFWALQITLLGVYASRSGRPLTLAWWQFLTAGVIGTVLTAVIMPSEFLRIPLVWPELLWTSVVSAGVAFTLQAVAQRHLPAPVAAIIMGSEMLFAALCGAIFLDEQLSPTQLLGGALIFASIVLVDVLPALFNAPARPSSR